MASLEKHLPLLCKIKANRSHGPGCPGGDKTPEEAKEALQGLQDKANLELLPVV